MLLTDLSKETVSLDEYRIIAEIYLDRLGLQAESNSIETISLSKLFPDPSRPIISMLRYIEQTYKVPKDKMQTLSDGISNHLLTYTKDSLLSEYCHTNKIKDMIKRKTEAFSTTPIVPESIVDMFAEETRKYYSTNYVIGSGPPIAYLTNAYTQYFRNTKSEEIYSSINARGTLLSLDDGDVSITDKLYIEIDKLESIDFRKVATTIYNSSEILYSQSSGSDTLEVYYDLFSKFKYRKIEEIYKKIDKAFANSFGSRTSMPVLSTRDVNDKSIGSEYKHNTLKSRHRMIALLEPYLGNCIPPSELNRLYDRFKYLDENRANNKNSNALFKSGTGSGKNISNVDKFNLIVYGFSSVSYFLKYLKKVGISPFDVPSTIFQDASYIKRFKTLQEYLMAHAKTEELKANSAKIVEVIPTNDELYDSLSGPLKQRLTSFRFSSIKDIIDGTVSVEDVNKQGNYLNYSLIRDAKTRAIADMNLKYFKDKNTNENTTLLYLHALIEQLNKTGWTGCVYTGDGFGLHEECDYHYEVNYKQAVLPNNPTLYKTIQGIIKTTASPKDADIHEHFQGDQILLDLLRYTHLKLGVMRAIRDLATELLEVKSYLNFLDLSEKKPELFDIPLEYSSINSILRILSDYKVPLVLEADDDVSANSEKYKMMYAFAIDGYEKFLRYVHNHRVKLYKDLAENYICKTNMFTITSNILKTRAAELVYLKEHTTPKFSVFKSLCTIGDYDYLYKDGKPYTEIFGNDVRYLHSKGYWVYQNDLNIEEVSEFDSFGGE